MKAFQAIRLDSALNILLTSLSTPDILIVQTRYKHATEMKIDANLEQIQILVPNITIVSCNRGWYEIKEQKTKIHGWKKLQEVNERYTKEEELDECADSPVCQGPPREASRGFPAVLCKGASSTV